MVAYIVDVHPLAIVWRHRRPALLGVEIVAADVLGSTADMPLGKMFSHGDQLALFRPARKFRRGATVGKMAIGFRVSTSDGARLSFTRHPDLAAIFAEDSMLGA